jgi:hypothetical protein
MNGRSAQPEPHDVVDHRVLKLRPLLVVAVLPDERAVRVRHLIVPPLRS